MRRSTLTSTVRDFRRVGPERRHDVGTNAQRLGVLYTLEVELTRLLGGWTSRRCASSAASSGDVVAPARGRSGQDYAAAYAGAKASLEEFMARHDEVGGDSPIPLVRLGAEETGSGRLVNVGAKRLLGFTDAEIEDLAASSSGTVDD